jgi:PKD repeat protein
VPTANFTFSPGAPGRNDLVVFDASSSTTAQGQTIVDVAWNFGDGTGIVHCPSASSDCPGPTNRISSHTFTTAQTFTVNLVVTDSAGRTGSKNTSVQVALAQPNVVITTSPSSPNIGTVVQFNSNGTTYYPGSTSSSFAWTFGDGGSCSTAVPAGCGTGTPANPSHVYTGNGGFSVSLSVTDNKARTGVGGATVTVVAPTPPAAPVAVFTPTATTLPNTGGSVFFDAGPTATPSGSAIINYRWNFGDGSPIVNNGVGAPTVSHNYAAAVGLKTYTVTLTVTDGNGLTSTTTGTVTEGP